MITLLLVVLLLGEGVADKTELANQRLKSTNNGSSEEQILQSTSNSRPIASKFKHHPSYSNKDLSFTKYDFFRPNVKGHWDHRSQKPGGIQGPLAGMLKKLLLTGKFDAVASFVRLELSPNRKAEGFYQRPVMSPIKQMSYYYDSKPSPYNFQPQKSFPFKGIVGAPQLTLLQIAVAKPLSQIQVAQPLPQVAGGQPVPHIEVAQPLPPAVAQPLPSLISQNGATSSYAVPEQSGLGIPFLLPELLRPQFLDQASIPMNSGSEVSNGFNGQHVEVPFESMYHQYQTMKGEEINEKFYKELSKLYDIMHALKVVNSEPFTKDSKVSGMNTPTLPNTPHLVPTLSASKKLS